MRFQGSATNSVKRVFSDFEKVSTLKGKNLLPLGAFFPFRAGPSCSKLTMLLVNVSLKL